VLYNQPLLNNFSDPNLPASLLSDYPETGISPDPTPLNIIYPPVATDDSYITNEDVAINDNVLSNDYDPEGDNMLVNTTPVVNVTNGILVMNTDGSFTYTPNTNFSGSDSFTYEVCDDDSPSQCAQAVVSITVNVVNDAPVAVHNTFTTLMDSPVSGNLLDNDSDPEGNTLSLSTSPVSGPLQGTVTLNAAGTFTYTPNAGFTGLDQFEYEVCDNGSPIACTTENVYVRVLCDTRSTLDWDNYAFSFNPDGVLLRPDSFMVTTTLRDPYAKATDFYVSDLLKSTHSLLWLVEYNNVSQYTEVKLDFHQPLDYLTFTLFDVDKGGVGGHEDIIEVSAYAGGVIQNLTESNFNTGKSMTFIGGNRFQGLLPSDFNSTDGDLRISLDFPADSVIIRHSLPLIPAGSYTYGISIHDISWCNSFIIASDDSYSVDEDDPTTNFMVSANDTDPDNNYAPSTISIVNSPNQGGTATAMVDGSIDYAPAANFNGTETLVYQICDGGGLCDQATVTITVNPVNDAPVAADDSYSTDEDTPLNIAAAGILTNDSDIDGDALTAVLESDVSNGTLTLNADGSFAYIPAADFHGGDSFTYRANDGTVNSNIATVTITVNPVNDAPVAADDSYSTDEDVVLNGNVLENDSDTENDNLILNTTPIVNVTNGTLVLMTNGDFSFTPDAGYYGADSFTYEVCDDGIPSLCSQAIANITINPVNDNLPPEVENIKITIVANSDTTLCINATDPDGDSLFINSVSVPPVNGSLVLSNIEPLCLLYRPNVDFSGTDEIVVEVCDGQTCVVATIQIIVEEIPLFIYQALSPNNDNYNDTWIIDGITRYPDNEVKIYNRYGNLVYQGTGYNNIEIVWKGEANTGMVLGKKELPDGTYFYVIDLGDGSKSKSGYVVLHR